MSSLADVFLFSQPTLWSIFGLYHLFYFAGWANYCTAQCFNFVCNGARKSRLGLVHQWQKTFLSLCRHFSEFKLFTEDVHPSMDSAGLRSLTDPLKLRCLFNSHLTISQPRPTSQWREIKWSYSLAQRCGMCMISECSEWPRDKLKSLMQFEASTYRHQTFV